MQSFDREDAIAYGWYMAIVFVIGAGIVYAAFTPVMNGFLDFTNIAIDDGSMSVQTKSAIGFNLGVFAWIPVFALIGILLWSIIRALEQKRLGQ